MTEKKKELNPGFAAALPTEPVAPEPEEPAAPEPEEETVVTPAAEPEKPKTKTEKPKPEPKPEPEAEPEPDKIRDPEAFARAKAEQLERLTKKYQSELAELQAERDKAKQDAEKARVAALRTAALAEAGLSPEMAEFIHGRTEETIKAQVEKLAAAMPQKSGSGRIGNSASTVTDENPIIGSLKGRQKGQDLSNWDRMKLSE